MRRETSSEYGLCRDSASSLALVANVLAQTRNDMHNYPSPQPGAGDYPGDTHVKKSANARFAIKSWDEKPYSEGENLPRLTRATVTKTLTGDIEGEGHVEYLMMYRDDGSASFVGIERVVGRVGERSGSFVLQRVGVFEGGLAKESYSVIPGSGTGDLRGLQGDGRTAVGHGTEHPFTLAYDLT
jgi:hypothetical protein